MKNLYLSCIWPSILLGVLSICSLSGQSGEDHAESVIEYFADSGSEGGETDFTGISELPLSPLDLNQCSLEDLLDTGVLSPHLASAIIHYREALGPFLDLHELQAVPGLDLGSLQRLLPWVILNNEDKGIENIRENLQKNRNHELVIRWRKLMEKQAGYLGDSAYEGNSHSHYIRWRMDSGPNFKMSLLAEKDAGEPFLSGVNRYGYDHYAGFVQLTNTKRWMPKLILGDLKPNWGQGLVAFGGYRPGKSAEVMSVSHGGKRLYGYSSLTESGFLRGMATEIQIRSNKIISFLSLSPADASLDTLWNPAIMDSVILIRALSMSGLHRTAAEMERKHNIHVKSVGLRLEHNRDALSLGMNGITCSYPYSFNHSDSLYLDPFPLSGKIRINGSMDYTVQTKYIHFSGEMAVTEKWTTATVHSMIVSLSPKLDISLLHRFFSVNYQSTMGQGFGQYGTMSNEHGFYIGIWVKPNDLWECKAYADLWYSPWLRHNIASPSHGFDYLIKISFRLKKKMESYLMYKISSKAENEQGSKDAIPRVIQNVSRQIRGQLNLIISRSLEMRSRIAFHFHNRETAPGLLMYQDIIYRPRMSPISLTARYAIFDSPAFDTRIYAYENDLLYQAGIPAYDKRGSRFYINLRYNILRSITLEGRLSRFWYPEERQISSGNDRIEGNTKTELKLQLRLKF